jgi:triosephosphate isomerase (TIM)
MPKTIIANWKSNLNINQALYWLEQVEEYFFDSTAKLFFKDYNLVVAPPYPLIPVLYELAHKLKIKLAVQDISSFGAGSYTGAVCAENLAGLGVSHAIVGHSERRRHFCETHEMVADKLLQAWQAEMSTVLCVDEPDIKPQRLALDEKYPDWLSHQDLFTIAYEPLSAIGSGQSADLDQVKQMVAAIKQDLADVPVLYGGSVTAKNIAEFMQVTDGVLVGGVSLKAFDFIALLEAVKKNG